MSTVASRGAPASQLVPSFEGAPLHHFKAIGSTNDEAARLAADGAVAGTMVLADRQTSGRGRLGRVWQSELGNLYGSIVLRPACSLRTASQLSLLAAVALVDLLDEHAPEDRTPRLQCKWPNDVLLDGAKIAGILLESAHDKGGQLAHVVVGLGLNVAWSPQDAAYPVTSLEAEGFVRRAPKEWLHAYASRLGIWLDRWQRTGFSVVRQAWCARSYGLGERVRLRLDKEEITGRFLDLTEEGALLIERADGSRQSLTAGEVLHAGM